MVTVRHIFIRLEKTMRINIWAKNLSYFLFIKFCHDLHLTKMIQLRNSTHVIELYSFRTTNLNLPHCQSLTLNKKYFQFGQFFKSRSISDSVLFVRFVSLDKKLQRFNNFQSLNKTNESNETAVNFKCIKKIYPWQTSLWIDNHIVNVSNAYNCGDRQS